MKLKIVSDGSAPHTQIIDVETGETLENVRKVSWEVEAGGPDASFATARLTLFPVSVEVVGECVNAECPRLWEAGCQIEPGDAAAIYEEWKRDPSTARSYAEVRAELIAEGKLHET